MTEEPLSRPTEDDVDDLLLDDYVIVPSRRESVTESVISDDYYEQFAQPDDDEDEDYFNSHDNIDVFLNQHLHRQQLEFIESLEYDPYRRVKRSEKKIKAKRQIKDKHARSIKINSHNQHLYIHHRLFKRVVLDGPSGTHIKSQRTEPSHSSEDLHLLRYPKRSARAPTPTPTASWKAPISNPIPQQLRDYTINEHTMHREPAFDDAMIAFLLEMQNRDLSPEDYEMLLRLDERVQRKTVNKSVLKTLPTVTADDTHLHDQCSICMENYSLGQNLKLLPCKHLFHIPCIETYLEEFSNQCPLDNLPLA